MLATITKPPLFLEYLSIYLYSEACFFFSHYLLTILLSFSAKVSLLSLPPCFHVTQDRANIFRHSLLPLYSIHPCHITCDAQQILTWIYKFNHSFLNTIFITVAHVYFTLSSLTNSNKLISQVLYTTLTWLYSILQYLVPVKFLAIQSFWIACHSLMLLLVVATSWPTTSRCAS